MRSLILLGLLLMGAMARAENLPSLVVLPLGDSITEGVPGELGYRGFLRDELASRGIRVRFTGTRQSPAGAHEGWSGFTADELLPRVEPALRGGPPDLVLLHIGTNDIGLGQKGESIAPKVAALLVRIAQLAPKAQVLLAQIIPMSRAGRAYEAEVKKFNESLVPLARARQQAGQKVLLVNLHDGIDPATDFHDALHPTVDGYLKVAQALAKAIATQARIPSR